MGNVGNMGLAAVVPKGVSRHAGTHIGHVLPVFRIMPRPVPRPGIAGNFIVFETGSFHGRVYGLAHSFDAVIRRQLQRPRRHIMIKRRAFFQDETVNGSVRKGQGQKLF